MPLDVDQIIRARIRMLIRVRGTSASAVSAEMGRQPTWLLQRLNEGEGRRVDIRAGDIRDILRHLGHDQDSILRPMLLPGDLKILRAVKHGMALPEGPRVAELGNEGYLTDDPPTLTNLGRLAIRLRPAAIK